MTAWRVARAASLLLILLVLVASGVYFIVYLYRWEWNRAQISGLFFVAALITFTALVIIRSIRRVEERIERIERHSTDPWQTRTILREASGEPGRQRFDWLRRPPEGPAVFVPVLLGAGVILSFVIYVIEHAAAWFAGPTADRRTVDLLATDLPLGQRSEVPFEPGAPPARAPAPAEASRIAAWVIALSVAALLIGAAVNVIAEATQSRPETSIAPGEHTLLLDIDQRGEPHPPVVIAEALAIACRSRLPDGASVARIEPVDGRRVALILDHRLGELAERRYAGCLGDATLDRALVSVVRP